MAEYDPTDLDKRDRQRKDAETRQQTAQQRDDRDLRWLMSSRQGRRMVGRLLDQARVNEATFSTNALQMAFNEGFRNYGCWMLGRILDVCPELHLEWLKEQADERSNTSGDGPNSK